MVESCMIRHLHKLVQPSCTLCTVIPLFTKDSSQIEALIQKEISPFVQAENQMQLKMYDEIIIEIRDNIVCLSAQVNALQYAIQTTGIAQSLLALVNFDLTMLIMVRFLNQT